jgi:hypothetical protein
MPSRALRRAFTGFADRPSLLSRGAARRYLGLAAPGRQEPDAERDLEQEHQYREQPRVEPALKRTVTIRVLTINTITHIVLTRLLAIVETVRLGDPFVAENAGRLQTIGVSTMAHPLDIDWNFSLTRWLAVLLVFVLARVFEHGTRMRDELEGTV